MPSDTARMRLDVGIPARAARACYLVKINPEANERKFWAAWVDGEDFFVRWGRIGTAGTTQAWKMAGHQEALRQYERRVGEKMRSGYRSGGYDGVDPAGVPHLPPPRPLVPGVDRGVISSDMSYSAGIERGRAAARESLRPRTAIEILLGAQARDRDRQVAENASARKTRLPAVERPATDRFIMLDDDEEEVP